MVHNSAAFHPRALLSVSSVLLLLAVALGGCTPFPKTSLPGLAAGTRSPTSGTTGGPQNEPTWGMPFRAGLMGNIGLPENNPNSRLHDSNYISITDDTTGHVYQLGQGDGSDSASLDFGVYGGRISSDDISDENALALAPGRILAVQKDCNAVLIDHFNGWWVIYLHLDSDRIWVNSGDQVAAGTPIGVPTHDVSGCQQQSEYQHVHFAFLYHGQYVSMRDRRLCGHRVLDDGIEGVDLLPGSASPVPLDHNFIFTIPSNCPAEQPMTNVVPTNSSAGYRILRGNVTGLRAQWDMPQVSGPSDAGINASINVASWQGSIQGHPTDSMVIFTEGVVQSDGSVQYSNEVDIGSNASRLNVNIAAGDHISASIELTEGTSDTWVLTLTDTTHGQTDQLTVQNSGDATYPTFDIGPLNGHAAANFTPVHYSQVQIQVGNGGWADLGALPYQRTEMHDGDVQGALVAQASSVANNGFTVTRVNLGQ